ncbi:MAG: glycosyltransferase [Acidobacteriota bacterium]
MSPSLSVVIPAYNEELAIGATLQALSEYLRGTGLTFEIIVVDDGSTDQTAAVVRTASSSGSTSRLISLSENQGKGAALRRGVHEANGEVIAFIDADLPYSTQNLGDAIALVHSASTDIAIGARDLPASKADYSYPLLRRFMGKTFSIVVTTFLLPEIPDTQCGLKVFSAQAAQLLFTESKIGGFGFDFEVLFLAKKYGFRVERIPVSLTHRHQSKVRLIRDSVRMLLDVFRVRLMNRQMAYRMGSRCPICFSSEVTTLTQIDQYVIRACGRCKCRFLASFPSPEELEKLYNAADYFASTAELDRGYRTGEPTEAAARTNRRRFAILKKMVPSQGRVLEVGAGTGLFGDFVQREYDYVGIDLADRAAREARARGLEVYRASLSDFVNTGPSFDAVTLFHVFEHLADPHDALARIKDLLKPGGVVFLITPDTESLLCAISGRRWVSYKFPEHLILYSRSALIELLERSGFEIELAGSDYEYVQHDFLMSRVEQLSSAAAALVRLVLPLLPDPLPVGSGSIRLVARRRSGPPLDLQPIRTVEPTHAR